jgi:hypothetical protein
LPELPIAEFGIALIGKENSAHFSVIVVIEPQQLLLPQKQGMSFGGYCRPQA